MDQNFTAFDEFEHTMRLSEAPAMKFVEDVDYEFVGGGTAFNGY